MKQKKRHNGITLSILFLAAFLLTQLSFSATDSFALDNSSLNGTYAYVLKFSGFYGSDVNGGFGQVDQEWVENGTFIFDGTGGYVLSKDAGNDVLRTISETGGLSNTFTTVHNPGGPASSPGTYEVLGNGKIIFDGDEGATGIISPDGNTLIFNTIDAVAGSIFGTTTIVGFKKGTGLGISSLNGTYAFADYSSSFYDADANGGFGATDEADVGRGNVTFDGAGNCSGAFMDDTVARTISETPGLSNTFTTVYSQVPDTLPTCVYTVASDGAMTVTLDPGGLNEEVLTDFVVSADAATIIKKDVYALPGSIFTAGISVGVKKPTTFTNASVSGPYTWRTTASAFIDNDTNGGFGMTDVERIDRGDIIFDGAGGCSIRTNSTEDRIHRTIGETGGLSNTFTTAHFPDTITKNLCAYSVAPDGTMTLTIDPGGPGEFTLPVSIRSDGQFATFTVADTSPDWMETNLSLIIKRPFLPKDELRVDFGPIGLWAKYNNAGWTKLHTLSPTLTTTGNLNGGGKKEALAVFSPYGLYARYDNTGPWTRLHSLVPSIIATGDMDGGGADEVVAVFPPYGIYALYNNSGGWVRLTNLVPEQVIMADLDGDGHDDLVCDFGGIGIWAKYNNGAWTKIIGSNPGLMATGDLDGGGMDELIAYFPAFGGIWTKVNNAGWTKLHAITPESIVTADLNGTGKDEVIIDFGTFGIWAKYDNTTWTKIHAVSPDSMTTGDLDGTGSYDLVADFGAFGIYAKYNDGAWTKIHASNPELISTGNMDGN